MTQPVLPLLARTALATAALSCTLAQAVPVQVTVNVQNLAATNSVGFAPLHVGFHNGTFDGFSIGQTVPPGVQSVAESGSGAAWMSAFSAADPGATLGSIGGALLPGASFSLSFTVDPIANPYFSFVGMVLPSNDFFIGNDSATAFRLFDAAGAPQLSSITQRASQIWDAGSELFNPAHAVFVAGADGNLRADQNSVVAFNFAELTGFNGLTTGAGYVFNSGLSADTEVYHIGFSVSPIPEPQRWALMLSGLLGLGWLARRRGTGAR